MRLCRFGAASFTCRSSIARAAPIRRRECALRPARQHRDPEKNNQPDGLMDGTRPKRPSKQLKYFLKWRREQDSNPRYAKQNTRYLKWSTEIVGRRAAFLLSIFRRLA